MSLPFVIENILELIIVFSCIVIALIIRKVISSVPLTKESAKVKKYSGFIMLGISMVGIMDLSYATYRFYIPSNPYEFIGARPTISVDNCVRVVR